MTEAEILQETEEPEAKRMKQGTLIIQLQVGCFFNNVLLWDAVG